tara:strand:+ start:10563 stop:11642 length:1080 start_codon:yes stop_codon:yes gene_type:complete
MNKKIIFSAGGTGGHLFPALHLMDYFSENGYEVLLVTDKRGKNFIKNSTKYKVHVLNVETFTNKNFFKKILSFFIILYSLVRSIFILKKEKPNLIFGLGGYVSFPISLVSKFFNLPLVIYENNAILGRANKYLSFFAKRILCSKDIKENFTEKYKNKTYFVGSILNKNILNFEENCEYNKKGVFSILILGGSQGAEIFGNVIPPVIKMLKEAGNKIKVYQQCLKKQKNEIINFYEKNNIENYIFEFEEDIFKLILSSDLAITRCGASTTEELIHALTPFVAIPLPNSIDNHQYLNAKYYEKRGCCWIIKQDNCNAENLFNLIIKNIKNENELVNIRKNMKKNKNKNVYNNIEKLIKDFV